MPPSKVASFEQKSFSWSPTKECYFLYLPLSSYITILLRFFIKSNQETISVPTCFFVSPSPPQKKTQTPCCFFVPQLVVVFFHAKKNHPLGPEKNTPPGGDQCWPGASSKLSFYSSSTKLWSLPWWWPSTWRSWENRPWRRWSRRRAWHTNPGWVGTKKDDDKGGKFERWERCDMIFLREII